ncbi:MAG TPA: pyridoxal-dependent decarboxylase [Chryseolinea sp.]|nr:pyridoxal-dependent decarboxylase [Chryseolinea sp.]
MDGLLKKDLENLSGILNHAVEIAQHHFNRQQTLPPGRFIPDLPMADIPSKGIGAIATLDYFEHNFADKLANSTGARYFGFVTGGSTPASVAGDWLVSAYDQNACGSNDSIAPQIERQTIHFFKELFGLDPEYFGSFVTGATLANFTSLALARQWVGEQRGLDFSNEGLTGPPVKVLSATAHSSILKSLSMVGIGRKSLIKLETLPEREAVDIKSLEKTLRENLEPLIVVANAGTVNTVDFDDLEAIGALKTKYNFWLHVDAAFGGFAACSEKYSHLVKGMNHADSITIDAHKWLNVPYDAAMQFTRHKDIQLRVFQNSAAYLTDAEKRLDYFHYTPENSRRFRALPAWFTLVAYGKEGHREIVERNCDVAQYFGELIKSSEDFTLLAPVNMNVVCFTLKDENLTADTIRKFLEAVRDDGRVFFTPTVLRGVPAIRAAISNWLTKRDDIDLAFEVINTVNQKLKRIQLA